MKHKKQKKAFLLILLSLIFIPGLEVLLMIGFNSGSLIRLPIFIAIIVLIVLFTLLLVIELKIYYKAKKKNKDKIKTWIKAFLTIFMIIYVSGCITFVVLLYGPNEKFKTWLITTAMSTMNHQYLCKWFYSEEQINEILDNNYVLESGESTDVTLIKKHNYKYRKDEYESDYEREILDVDDDIDYQIIEFEVNDCIAHLAVIYDPSKVRVEVTEYLGVKGQYVTTMAERNDAIIGINGGGFYDPGNMSAGGTPTGITIKNGEIITNGEYGTDTQSGGIIGFTDDDILVLLKNATAEEAINMGVRDAVSWGPFLIVNGEPSFIRGNGGWGYAARSDIGQREDGIVLLLVVDSNSTRTKGADMIDLVEIMQNYGAINAANLDGGTSSVMVMPKDIAIDDYDAPCTDYYTDNYCAINDPIDGGLYHRTRPIADAWIVDQ